MKPYAFALAWESAKRVGFAVLWSLAVCGGVLLGIVLALTTMRRLSCR